MKRTLIIPAVLGGLAIAFGFTASPAEAHCDSVDGPVASAAMKALDTRNVNVVLPYAPASAESEMTAAFNQTMAVRTQGVEAKMLADRYFMETVVRLHRLGESASYTGLKPAGIDFGPAIPAADKAISDGTTAQLIPLLTREVEQAVATRFEHVMHVKALPAEAATPTEVSAARERVEAELGFVTFVEGIYAATQGSTHAE